MDVHPRAEGGRGRGVTRGGERSLRGGGASIHGCLTLKEAGRHGDDQSLPLW